MGASAVVSQSMLHLDRFKPGGTVAWFALFGIGAVAFFTALTKAWLARMQGVARA
jgi:hypothetical protein